MTVTNWDIARDIFSSAVALAFKLASEGPDKDALTEELNLIYNRIAAHRGDLDEAHAELDKILAARNLPAPSDG